MCQKKGSEIVLPPMFVLVFAETKFLLAIHTYCSVLNPKTHGLLGGVFFGNMKKKIQFIKVDISSWRIVKIKYR